jgi:hypothetical protein
MYMTDVTPGVAAIENSRRDIFTLIEPWGVSQSKLDVVDQTHACYMHLHMGSNPGQNSSPSMHSCPDAVLL